MPELNDGKIWSSVNMLWRTRCASLRYHSLSFSVTHMALHSVYRCDFTDYIVPLKNVFTIQYLSRNVFTIYLGRLHNVKNEIHNQLVDDSPYLCKLIRISEFSHDNTLCRYWERYMGSFELAVFVAEREEHRHLF